MKSRTISLALLCGSITRFGWYAMRDELLSMVEDDAARGRLQNELNEILEYVERVMGPRGDDEFYQFLSRNTKPA